MPHRAGITIGNASALPSNGVHALQSAARGLAKARARRIIAKRSNKNASEDRKREKSIRDLVRVY